MFKKSYWVNGYNIIDLGGKKHIDYILKNPADFGFTMEELKQYFDKHGEPFGHEGFARDEIIKDVVNLGWIRIRKYSRPEEWSITCDIFDLRLPYIKAFVSWALTEGEVMHKDDILKVVILGDGEEKRFNPQIDILDESTIIRSCNVFMEQSAINNLFGEEELLVETTTINRFTTMVKNRPFQIMSQFIPFDEFGNELSKEENRRRNKMLLKEIKRRFDKPNGQGTVTIYKVIGYYKEKESDFTKDPTNKQLYDQKVEEIKKRNPKFTDVEQRQREIKRHNPDWSWDKIMKKQKEELDEELHEQQLKELRDVEESFVIIYTGDDLKFNNNPDKITYNEFFKKSLELGEKYLQESILYGEPIASTGIPPELERKYMDFDHKVMFVMTGVRTVEQADGSYKRIRNQRPQTYQLLKTTKFRSFSIRDLQNLYLSIFYGSPKTQMQYNPDIRKEIHIQLEEM